MLLAQHIGCLSFTDEGFDDAVAALSGCAHAGRHDRAERQPEFAAALRDFCESLG